MADVKVSRFGWTKLSEAFARHWLSNLSCALEIIPLEVRDGPPSPRPPEIRESSGMDHIRVTYFDPDGSSQDFRIVARAGSPTPELAQEVRTAIERWDWPGAERVPRPVRKVVASGKDEARGIDLAMLKSLEGIMELFDQERLRIQEHGYTFSLRGSELIIIPYEESADAPRSDNRTS